MTNDHVCKNQEFSLIHERKEKKKKLNFNTFKKPYTNYWIKHQNNVWQLSNIITKTKETCTVSTHSTLDIAFVLFYISTGSLNLLLGSLCTHGFWATDGQPEVNCFSV